MNWNLLTEEAQLSQLIEQSAQNPILIFKHSTRCSISATALNRLERNWNDTEMSEVRPFYLDLIRYRNVSNQIANLFEVEHQSPQVLLLKEGKCSYHASHFDITYQELKTQLV